MINPPPRPALRKAPDADVHPVAAVPTAPTPAPRPELRPVPLANVAVLGIRCSFRSLCLTNATGGRSLIDDIFRI